MKIIKEYTIKEEQEIQLSLLKYFDYICKNEHLNYYLAYGTLLGAVRESGFISWDDDIDLWMLRDDYEKLRKVCKNYSREELFFQDFESDPDTPVPAMLRICVNNTYKWRPGNENQNFHTGIYFDIFPLDYVNGDDSNIKIDNKKQEFYNDVVVRNLYGKRKHKTLKGKLYSAILKLFPKKVARRKIAKFISQKREPSNSLISYSSCAYFPKNIFRYEDFNGVEYMQFEDMKCPCPVGFDRVLTELYGDWRTPIITKPEHIKAYQIKQE